MPQPTRSQVHVSVPLTNLSVAYIQSASEFIADKIFPNVPVDKQADIYYTYPKNAWFRDEAQQRAPGTESVGSGYGLATDDYSCKVWAFHKDVDDQVRANADSVLNLDRDANEFVMQRLMIRRERQFVDTYFKAGVWGKDYAGVAAAPGADQFIQWSDYTNSDPITDVKNARLYIKSITGYRPNVLLLGEEVFESLKQHPDIIDRYKYTQAGVVTVDLIARLFEVDRIVIGGAIYASNVEGATDAFSFVYGKKAMLCYSAPRPSLLQPSAGYTFSWKGYLGNNAYGVATKKFRMEQLESDRIEGSMSFDQKLVAADLGVFFETAIA